MHSSYTLDLADPCGGLQVLKKIVMITPSLRHLAHPDGLALGHLRENLTFLRNELGLSEVELQVRR